MEYKVTHSNPDTGTYALLTCTACKYDIAKRSDDDAAYNLASETIFHTLNDNFILFYKVIIFK